MAGLSPDGETMPEASGVMAGAPQLLRKLSVRGPWNNLGPSNLAIMASSIAIYKPSPSATGELQPHAIAVGTLTTWLPIFCSESGRLLANLQASHSQPHVITFQNPDEKPVIITKSKNGWVRAWDGDDYHLIFEREICQGSSLRQIYAYAHGEPEERRLRVVAMQTWLGPHNTRRDEAVGLVHILNGDTGETLHALMLEEQMQCLGGYFYSDGGRQRIVTAGTGGLVVVIDPEAGHIVQQMRGHTNFNVELACFESDESTPVPYVVVSCESGDHNVQVWFLAAYDAQLLYAAPGHPV
jgi:WD40 repeat protein